MDAVSEALDSDAWLAEKTAAGFPMLPLVEAGIVPVKFAECLEHNQLLRPCCRKIENMTARLFKTDPRLPQPDGFVATCSCGRNHIRVRHDPGRFNAAETEAERIARATHILDQPFDSAPKTGETIHASKRPRQDRQGAQGARR